MASRSISSRRPKNHKVDLPDAFADLFKPFRYKAFYGGRGSGKSHAMATALVLLAAQRPLRVLAAREIQRSIRDSAKRLLDDRIVALGLQKRFTSTETEIRARNGSLILFAGLGQNPDQHQIHGRASTSPGSRRPTPSRSARSTFWCRPSVKPGSELWFAWNPRHESDPVDADVPPRGRRATTR